MESSRVSPFAADENSRALSVPMVRPPSRSIAAVDLYIAKERGFFRDEGLDVDIVQIRGNVAVAAALSPGAGHQRSRNSHSRAGAERGCRVTLTLPASPVA